MSSKIARRPWSLAARMAAWYGLTALAVAGGGAAAAYATVRLAVDREIACEFPAAAREVHTQRERLAAGRLDESGVVRVIGPDGAVRFAAPRLAEAFPPSALPRPGAGPVDRLSPNGTPFTLAAEAVDGWEYQFAIDRTQEAEFFAKLRLGVALAVAPTLAAGLAVGYGLARLGLRPTRRLAADMRGVSADRLGERVPADRLPAELLEVAESFNAVLGRLQEAFDRLDQFSADVAHELRTPVHNLRHLAEIALAGGPEGDRQALGRVLDESDRLARLIERLLLFARLADPRAGVSRVPVRVADELAAAAEFFAPAAAERGVRLSAEAPPGLTFPLDDSLFQRAVSNLVANAVAHTPPGGEVRLTAECGPGGLRVEVRDSGRGIDPADLPRLFDRFYRPPQARAAGRGVGLGLAIVRRAVELHGGTVTVESTPGEGTAVRMDFPAAEDDTDVIRVPRP